LVEIWSNWFLTNNYVHNKEIIFELFLRTNFRALMSVHDVCCGFNNGYIEHIWTFYGQLYILGYFSTLNSFYFKYSCIKFTYFTYLKKKNSILIYAFNLWVHKMTAFYDLFYVPKRILIIPVPLISRNNLQLNTPLEF
jgi:hypothetical protein